LEPVDGRPGATLKPYDFDSERELLAKTYGKKYITEKDLLSYALYPSVFEEWKEFEQIYGDVETLPTHVFLNPMVVGEEIELDLGPGNSIVVRLVSIGNVDETGTRMCLFEVNGEQIFMGVTDNSVEGAGAVREKAKGPKQVGSPMPGVVVSLKVKAGDVIKEGETVATLSAMKMETSIPATASGIIKRVVVNVGDKVEGDDLMLEIE
jgi:pyruvate carboxylase